MKDVSFVYDSCRALCRPQGAYHRAWADSLIFNVEGAQQFVEAAQDAGRKVNAELVAAVRKIKGTPTTLTKDRDKRRADLDAARSKLAMLEGQPAMLKARINSAIVNGDTDAADEAESELPSLQTTIDAARNRVEILAGLVEEAEQAVEAEQRGAVVAMSSKRRAELQAALDKAKAALSRAVGETFPAVVVAEQALAGAEAGYVAPAIEEPQASLDARRQRMLDNASKSQEVNRRQQWEREQMNGMNWRQEQRPIF